MGVYKGSIGNLPFLKRIVMVLFGIIVPPLMVLVTFAAFLLCRWWAFFLIPDLLVLILGFSIWGTLIWGSSLQFDDDGIRYMKGFQKGYVSYSDIIKVYQISLNKRNSTMILFGEGEGSAPRCFCVGQSFSEEDKISILRELIAHCGRGGYDIIDDASIQLIRSDKKNLGWVYI